MGIITEYLTLQKQAELKYGPRTVILMQVGSFYETYEYRVDYCMTPEAKVDKDGKVWNESIGHSVEISGILESTLTMENKNEPYTISNPHKMGFPCIALERYQAKLLANDYTVVRYDQAAKKADGTIERYQVDAISPTMNLDGIALTRATSNVAVIYIEYQSTKTVPRYENFLITTGVAVVDIITGQNRVCEFYSKLEDQVYAVQELYRFLIAHYPRELLIHIGDMPQGLDQHSEANPNGYVKYLQKMLELKRFDRLTVNVNKVPPEYKKPAYQVEFLNKLFTKQGVVNPRLNIIQKRNERIIEELGLERMNYGRMAYLLLMQHCNLYNSDIISRLSKPDLQWLDQDRHLVLTHNAIVQLGILSPKDNGNTVRKSKEIDSLMSILDHNQTHLGRRALHTLLQNPLANPHEIRMYYDMVDEMLETPEKQEPLWLVLDRLLKELPDIARLQRKLEIKLITPKELAILYNAYVKIINIYVTVIQTKSPVLHKQMLTTEDVNNFNGFMARFGAMFDFEALECCHVDTSADSTTRWLEFTKCPIKPGYYADLDQQREVLMNAEHQLERIIDHMNGFLVHTRGKKLEISSAKREVGAKKQDPTATVIVTSSAKAELLSKARIDTNLCGNLQVLSYTTADRMITSDIIGNLCTTIDTIRMWMRQRLLGIYESVVEEMVAKYNFFVNIANFIAKLDLTHSYAKAAHLYNYHRPDVVMEPSDVSYFEARDMRHPIIERLIDGAYVCNDLALGAKAKDEVGQRSQGKLLFGVNQVGKSSLIKSPPLLTIMAQIGSYVPASYFRYVPYLKIITRLDGNDNIFQGQSTFAVEITELRTILRQADARTMVAGDEVAKGTESHSGMAIMAAAILYLIKRRTTFMFATHMHELLNLLSIKDLPEDILQVCHLSISYDEATKDLIYDRKLRPGPGLSVYGLMVARSLELPDEFIDQANFVLQEVMGNPKELLNPKRSKYNTDVFVDECAVPDCGARTDLQTHHIIEQKYADNNQLVKKVIQTADGSYIDVGIMHKNAKDNLIVLCRKCHTKLHRDNKQLETVSVSNGTVIRHKPEQPNPELTKLQLVLK